MMKCCLSCKMGWWDNPDCNLCKDNLNANYISNEICYLVECGLETIGEDCESCRFRSRVCVVCKELIKGNYLNIHDNIVEDGYIHQECKDFYDEMIDAHIACEQMNKKGVEQQNEKN